MSEPTKTKLGNLGKDYGAGKRPYEWETPQHIFDILNEEFEFTLDVASSDLNHKCEKYFTKKDNGLERSWANHRCWMNPPYGRDIIKWVEKAVYETMNKCEIVVGLLPVRSDTLWFHRFVLPNAEIRFIKGRLKFNNTKSSAPFASMICVWRNLDIVPIGLWGEEFEVKSVDYRQETLV